ncbi:MAG: TolC family protein [bacterium]|nr:TolC family protein [bacterium]
MLVFLRTLFIFITISSLAGYCYGDQDPSTDGSQYEEFTLQDAVSLTLSKNPELSAQNWEIRARDAAIRQAGVLPNPEFGFEAENFLGTRDFEKFHNAEMTYQLSQLIELGGKISKRKKISMSEKEIALIDCEIKKFSVLSRMKKSFYDVFILQEKRLLLEDTLNAAKNTYDMVSERVDAGKSPRLDQLKAEIELALASNELNKSKRSLSAEQKKLLSFWGEETFRYRKVSADTEDIPALPDFDLLASCIADAPDILRSKKEIEKSNAQLELEKAKRISDITVEGGLRGFNVEADRDDYAFVAGISIPLPLFDRNQGNIEEAGYQVKKAHDELAAARANLYADLNEMYENGRNAYSELLSLKAEVLPGSDKAFSTARQLFSLGKTGYLDVLDSQRTFFETKIQYLETLLEYHKILIDIEQTIAQSILSPEEN